MTINLPMDAQHRPWGAECHALLLDLDGTLVDSSEAILRGWRAWAHAAHVSTSNLEEIVHGRSAAETISLLIPGVSSEELQVHVREVLKTQELDPSPAYPIPAASRLIEDIGGDRWAVVTGCSMGMAQARLQACNLPIPDVLITDESVNFGKPHPQGFLLALQHLNIASHQAVAVEDAPAGVTAAKAAGLRTVAVTSTHKATALAHADVVVASLDEIKVTHAGTALKVAIRTGENRGNH